MSSLETEDGRLEYVLGRLQNLSHFREVLERGYLQHGQSHVIEVPEGIYPDFMEVAGKAIDLIDREDEHPLFERYNPGRVEDGYRLLKTGKVLLFCEYNF